MDLKGICSVGDLRAYNTLDSLDPLLFDPFDIQFSFASHTYDIGFVPVYAVFLDQLVEAVCIAWL